MQRSFGATMQRRRGLNEALAATSLAELCQLYTPIAPPVHPPAHVAYPPSSYFHTSALLAAAIDTATMPIRTLGTCSEAPFPNILQTFFQS